MLLVLRFSFSFLCRELDLMVLMAPFQLEIFCDSGGLC